MKNKFSKRAINGFIAVIIAAFFGGGGGGAATIQAQLEVMRSEYVISARAGGINFAAGDVTITRKGATASTTSVSTRDALESGDRLQTGTGGRVEILLNPGSYLRLAENSELELSDASLDSLRVRLQSGVAMIEVAGAGDRLAVIEVRTPNARFLIERKGLYRIESQTATGADLVRVQKGCATVNGEEIKDGKEITISPGGAASSGVKFDKKEQDAFDLWSAARGETLAEANRKLSRQTVSSLYSSYRNDPLGGRRGFGGYWLYDPFFGARTFLPYYSGWSSPYGHGYSRGFGFSRSGRFGSSGFGLFGRGSRIGVGISTGRGSGHRQTIHHRTVHHGRGGRGRH